MKKNEIITPEVPDNHGDWMTVHFGNGRAVRVPVGQQSLEMCDTRDCVRLHTMVHPDIGLAVGVLVRPNGALAWCGNSIKKWYWGDWRLMGGDGEAVVDRKKLKKALLRRECRYDRFEATYRLYCKYSQCVMTRLTANQRDTLKKLLENEIDIFGLGAGVSESIDWWLNVYKNPPPLA